VTAYVFVGPTLPPALLPALLAAIPGLVALPPVAQGDVYRAAQRRPRALGIVDGYFEGVPAVWHKEILWAMAEGIHVFGSASMGAMRAAELCDFGMQGVGRIFEAYRAGAWPPYPEPFEDDDEVAVIHAPAEAGYLQLSEPMVNIRATLAQAAAAAMIDAASRDTLAALAKGLFYPERSWERLLEAAQTPLPAAQLAALRAWLPQGRIDQKRLDAEAMLAQMAALLASDAAAKQVDYELEWTEAWDEATLAAAAFRAGGADASWLPAAQILDELRLDPGAYAAARDRALLRLLAQREAQRRHESPGWTAQRAALERLRTRHGLFRHTELERWAAARDLDAARLEQLVADEALLERLVTEVADGLDDRLIDDLRLHGDYPRLAARARDKQALLAAQGLAQACPEDAGVTPAALLLWYFEHRLGEPMPDDVDDAARARGFADRGHFYRALLREWLCCREGEPPP
jgi:hypothetical protein